MSRLQWWTLATIETLGWLSLGWGLWMAWPPLCPTVIGGIVVWTFMRNRG